jgi:hypothetical protein
MSDCRGSIRGNSDTWPNAMPMCTDAMRRARAHLFDSMRISGRLPDAMNYVIQQFC